MEKQDLFQQIRGFLFRDVKNENEGKRTAVVLRLLCVLLMIYGIILLALFGWNRVFTMLYSVACCMVVTAYGFTLTYRNKTQNALRMMNGVILLWIVFSVVVLGWDSGVQHFLFVMIVLLFMTSHAAARFKIAYAIGLCGVRMGLYGYVRYHEPMVQMETSSVVTLQLLNTVVVGSIIIMSMHLYSRESMEMESKLMLYNKKLQKMARMDALTGLPNRRAMVEYVEEAAGRYRSGSIKNLSIAIGDIDFFKKINDHYGHECGDVVLKQLAEQMEQNLGERATVGRWGGEEFLFVLPDLNGDEALAVLSDLLAGIRRMEIAYEDSKVSLTMTFGVAEYDVRIGVEQSIKDADDKLYMGKSGGRNQIVF